MPLIRFIRALLTLTLVMYLLSMYGPSSDIGRAAAAPSVITNPNPAAQPSAPQPQPAPRPVQLFDIRQERVIKTFSNNEYFQQAALEWLRSATKLSPQLNINSHSGYIVRVPLKEPYTLQLNQLQIVTKDVFMVYTANKPPLLLLFSPERKAYLIETNADVRPFMERILAPTGSGAARE